MILYLDSVECIYTLKWHPNASGSAVAILYLCLLLMFTFGYISISILGFPDIENLGIAFEISLMPCLESEMCVVSV